MIVSKRNYTVDIIRLIAAFGVICIHVPFDTPAAGAVNDFFSPLCVPFFFAVSLTYFVSGLKADLPVSDVFKKIGYRILLPYLAWTIVYVLAMVIKSRLVGLSHDTGGQFTWWRVLFYGESAVQLFYLPELIALQTTALSLYLIIYCNYKKKLTGLIILSFAILYYAWGYRHQAFGIPTIPAIIFYLLVGFLFAKSTRNARKNYVYLIAGCAITLFVLLGVYLNGALPLNEYTSKIPLAGLGLLLITLGLPLNNIPKRLSQVCSTSYGIYLSHVIFLEGFAVVLKKLLHHNLYYDLPVKLAMVGVIFIVSMVLTFLLQRWVLTKRVFLGE